MRHDNYAQFSLDTFFINLILFHFSRYLKINDLWDWSFFCIVNSIIVSQLCYVHIELDSFASEETLFLLLISLLILWHFVQYLISRTRDTHLENSKHRFEFQSMFDRLLATGRKLRKNTFTCMKERIVTSAGAFLRALQIQSMDATLVISMNHRSTVNYVLGRVPCHCFHWRQNAQSFYTRKHF